MPQKPQRSILLRVSSVPILLVLTALALLTACAPGTGGDTPEAPTPTLTSETHAFSKVLATVEAPTITPTEMVPDLPTAVTAQSESAKPDQLGVTPKAEAPQTETPEPTVTPPDAPVTESVTATVPSATPTNILTDSMPVLTGTTTFTGTAVSGPTDPTSVNGIPIDTIIVMPEGTRERVREIFSLGQAMGRDGHAFSKLGDSLIASPHFLTQFDKGTYDLGIYDYLQPAIDYWAGSFARYGVALRVGLHAWGVLDPMWSFKEWCEPNETMIACEFRYNNPSVLLILLGTNDSGAPSSFDYNMRKVVEYTIENGVVPVLVTKADRFEGPDNANNNILRQIAADYEIPLWDFDLVAETIPDRGLRDDQVHLTTFVENDFTLPEAYETGHGVHNLTGLMMLDAVRLAIEGG